MAILAIILIIVVILIVMELIKHHFTKGIMKYLIVAIVLLFLLLIASAYMDFGALIGKESTFSQTGKVIADGVSDDLKDIDIKGSETLKIIGEKTEELFRNLLNK